MGRPQKPSAEGMPGTLDILILSCVAKKSMHGFGIAEHLREVSEDFLRVEEGSLYPALHRLESSGFLTSEWRASENKRRARYYELTPRGRQEITTAVLNWRRLIEIVNRVVDPVVP